MAQLATTSANTFLLSFLFFSVTVESAKCTYIFSTGAFSLSLPPDSVSKLVNNILFKIGLCLEYIFIISVKLVEVQDKFQMLYKIKFCS